MKIRISAIIFILFCYTAYTISQVNIKILDFPINTPDSASIYITGNFNGWNPANKDYELKKGINGQYEINLTTSLKEIEFKFTLGSWEKVECSVSGSDIQNRISLIKPGDTIFVNIEGWKSGIKKHTASSNVSIVKEDFYMPQLDRKRRIWIYLPPGYNSSRQAYPVFYAHDGQNLFDAATSFSGEWGIDECLDSLFKITGKSSIIVGIDNGGEFRLEELTPWTNPKYGGGKAALYADFIVKTLKPYIDSTYRTLPGRKNTGVFGSSLGGLVSFYMILTYPEIFSKAGVFSPSFWYSEKVYELAENFTLKSPVKMFIIVGGKEDENLEKEVLRMKQILEKKGFGKKNMLVKMIPDGQHNEWFWRREFPEVYYWLSQ